MTPDKRRATLQDALAALENEVHARLVRGDAGERPSQTELRYRAQDYRTWQRMGEAPAHVQALAIDMRESLPPAPQDAIVTELVRLLARLYESLADDPAERSVRPVEAADAENA